MMFAKTIFLGASISVLGFSYLASASGSSYRQSVENWRHDYEEFLKADDGWLTVSGLFWLHEGENRFGSDPTCDIVLPAPSSPPLAGYFEFHEGKTSIHMNPAVKATLNGKLIQSAELRPYSRPHVNAGVQATFNAQPSQAAATQADTSGDRITMGDLILYVHTSGNRFAIRLKDKNSKLRRGFSGLQWFPIDESYRFTARYFAYDSPKQIETQNILGDAEKVFIVGSVAFSLQGQEYRLDAERLDSGGLFIVFRDLTSGKETYGAARFLAVEAPKGDRVVIDFNKAYNPPCAYNPYTTCPLPLPGNRLHVRIPAGEKMYKHEHKT
jgi:uncharacterized protein (DUF1684 family)